MKHQMDAVDGSGAEAGVSLSAFAVDTTRFHQFLIELLEVAGGQLHQFNVSDAGNGVGVHHEPVSFGGGLADIGPGIQMTPVRNMSVYFFVEHILYDQNNSCEPVLFMLKCRWKTFFGRCRDEPI